MKEIDFKLLQKRREKILKLRTEAKKEQHIGIGYELIIEGRHYPVMACFPVRTDDGFVKNKFEYLINGQKS